MKGERFPCGDFSGVFSHGKSPRSGVSRDPLSMRTTLTRTPAAQGLSGLFTDFRSLVTQEV